MSHFFGHFGYAPVVVGVFKSSGQGPVVGIVFVFHIERDISKFLVQSDAPVPVQICRVYACLKSFFCIEVTDSLHVGVHYDWHSMIAYHHVCLASPEIPYRQSSVLFVESKERFHHVVYS